jgi:hypothetical protein
MLEYTPAGYRAGGGKLIADTAAAFVLTDTAGHRRSQLEGDLALQPGAHGGYPGWHGFRAGLYRL